MSCKYIQPCELKAALEESQLAWQNEKRNKDVIQQRLLNNCLHEGLEFHGQTPADGNCLFHAVSDQLNSPNWENINHIDLRRKLAEFLSNNHKITVFISIHLFCLFEIFYSPQLNSTLKAKLKI